MACWSRWSAGRRTRIVNRGLDLSTGVLDAGGGVGGGGRCGE